MGAITTNPLQLFGSSAFEAAWCHLGDWGGQNRKFDELVKGLNDVKATQQQQQQQLDSWVQNLGPK